MPEKANNDNICTHHGRNIAKFRTLLGMNQEELGRKMNLSQAQISKYEQMEVIDDATLGKFSASLGVPVQILKVYDHDTTVNRFITYVNNISDNATFNLTDKIETQVNNPLDAILKMHNDIVSLTDKVARLETENEWLKKKNE